MLAKCCQLEIEPISVLAMVLKNLVFFFGCRRTRVSHERQHVFCSFSNNQTLRAFRLIFTTTAQNAVGFSRKLRLNTASNPTFYWTWTTFKFTLTRNLGHFFGQEYEKGYKNQLPPNWDFSKQQFQALPTLSTKNCLLACFVFHVRTLVCQNFGLRSHKNPGIRSCTPSAWVRVALR